MSGAVMGGCQYDLTGIPIISRNDSESSKYAQYAIYMQKQTNKQTTHNKTHTSHHDRLEAETPRIT